MQICAYMQQSTCDGRVQVGRGCLCRRICGLLCSCCTIPPAGEAVTSTCIALHKILARIMLELGHALQQVACQ